MAQRTRAELKAFFQINDTPTEAEYIDVFDSMLNFLSDGTPPTLAEQGGLNRKVINIGDWDMNGQPTITIAHGLDGTKIRNINVLIVQDNATDRHDFKAPGSSLSVGGGITQDGTNIIMTRASGGWFDTTDYDLTSFNRGFIVIDYIP